jgi:hypothetical protein
MLKQKAEQFAERLLSTKLMFCALVWSAANIWLLTKNIDGSIYRDITGLCLAGVLGASWIDIKKQKASGDLFDKPTGDKP